MFFAKQTLLERLECLPSVQRLIHSAKCDCSILYEMSCDVAGTTQQTCSRLLSSHLSELCFPAVTAAAAAADHTTNDRMCRVTLRYDRSFPLHALSRIHTARSTAQLHRRFCLL